jgi:hypothetical protein
LNSYKKEIDYAPENELELRKTRIKIEGKCKNCARKAGMRDRDTVRKSCQKDGDA